MAEQTEQRPTPNDLDTEARDMYARHRLTPRQLAQQRDELKEKAQAVVDCYGCGLSRESFVEAVGPLIMELRESLFSISRDSDDKGKAQ